jgi:23S rRNA (uracil1939-C5)-methyltransferase
MALRRRSGKTASRTEDSALGTKAEGCVERLATDGSGVLRRADGKVTFVPFSLPGESVVSTVQVEKKQYARAKLLSFESPSPLRVVPPCSHFTRCGGCQIQHIADSAHGEIKKQWFSETCRKLGRWPQESLTFLQNHMHVHRLAPLSYRQRARVHLSQTKRSIGPQRAPQSVTLGFRVEGGAGGLVDVVGGCPILVPEIVQALAPLRAAAARLLPGGTQLQAELTRHWPADSIEPKVALTLFKDNRDRAEVDRGVLKQFLDDLPAQIFCNPPDELLTLRSGGSWARSLEASEQKSNLGTGAVPEWFMAHRLGFVQPHEDAPSLYRSLSRDVIRRVGKEILGGLSAAADRSADQKVRQMQIWDLYGGCGLLSYEALAVTTELELTARISIVEQNEQSLFAAQAWRLRSDVPTGCETETFHMDTASFLQRRLHRADAPHLIIADPPRSGLGPETTAALLDVCRLGEAEVVAEQRKLPRLLLVFCDPASCARDTALFLSAGFRIRSLHLIDAFPQTHHYEVIVELEGEHEQKGILGRSDLTLST